MYLSNVMKYIHISLSVVPCFLCNIKKLRTNKFRNCKVIFVHVITLMEKYSRNQQKMCESNF